MAYVRVFRSVTAVVVIGMLGCAGEGDSVVESEALTTTVKPTTTTTEAPTRSTPRTTTAPTTTASPTSSTTPTTTAPSTTSTTPTTVAPTTTVTAHPRSPVDDFITADDLEGEWPLSVPPPAMIRCERVEDPEYDDASIATMSVVDPATETEVWYLLGVDGPVATAAGSDAWLLPLADEIRARYGDLTEMTDLALALCPD